MENTPTRLSPTAQTVLDSFLATDNVIDDRRYLYTDTKALADALRAALRAAADEVAPMAYEDVWTDGKTLQYEKQDPVRDKLLAIAAELERHYDSLYS